MSHPAGHRSLLTDLKRLYSHISLSLLNKRMGAYHKDIPTVSSQDVSARLSDQIEKLAASEQSRPKSEPGGNEVTEESLTEPVLDSEPDKPRKKTVLGRIANVFSHYLKGRAGNELNPQLSEKLKNSVWTHLHTALRHARQGEVVTAKLHADIANHALKEVAHYMSQDGYVEFSAEVDKMLEQIKDQS